MSEIISWKSHLKQYMYMKTSKEKTEEQCLKQDHLDRPLKYCEDQIGFDKEVNRNQLDVFQG